MGFIVKRFEKQMFLYIFPSGDSPFPSTHQTNKRPIVITDQPIQLWLLRFPLLYTCHPLCGFNFPPFPCPSSKFSRFFRYRSRPPALYLQWRKLLLSASLPSFRLLLRILNRLFLALNNHHLPLLLLFSPFVDSLFPV